jgi:dimeric dUTPase (all-alpha-NTP-PPase superfamily)
MNLEKMLEAQKVLDDRIIKEKGLERQDLFPNTVLALQVELAEFAQEGRWFKHWSDDQEPRTFVPNPDNVCEKCGGQGMLNMQAPFRGRIFCDECDGCGVQFHNPLLEEFADGVHFFLSIANQKGWDGELYIHEDQLDKEYFDDDLTGWYLEMLYFLNKCYFEKYPEDKKILEFQANAYFFRMAWILFLNLGVNGFGFTPEQIEQAYFEKNKVNHQRQESGY